MRQSPAWIIAAILVTGVVLGGGWARAGDTWSAADLDAIASEQTRVVAADGIFRLRTDHYRVVTEVDARFTAELAVYLERFDAAATEILALPAMASRAPAEVTVYSTQQRYQQALGKPLLSRGQFDWVFPYDGSPPRYTIQTFVANERERDFRRFCLPILNHETTHYLLQLRAGPNRIPNAIHEGVATYMQAWNLFESTTWNEAHRTSPFATELKLAVVGRSLPSISFLSAVSTWDVDNFGPVTNTRYASAESFVAFLLGDAGRKPFFLRLLGEALRGGDIHRVLIERNGMLMEADWRASLSRTFAQGTAAAAQPGDTARRM